MAGFRWHFFPLFSVSTMHTVGRDRAGTRGLSGTYTSSEEPLYLFQIFITRKILWQMDWEDRDSDSLQPGLPSTQNDSGTRNSRILSWDRSHWLYRADGLLHVILGRLGFLELVPKTLIPWQLLLPWVINVLCLSPRTLCLLSAFIKLWQANLKACT